MQCRKIAVLCYQLVLLCNNYTFSCCVKVQLCFNYEYTTILCITDYEPEGITEYICPHLPFRFIPPSPPKNIYIYIYYIMEALICLSMNHSRLRFKSALKFCQHNVNQMKTDALAWSMMNNDMNEFWKDVKKNTNSNVSLATNVDGSVGDTEIAEMWKCHYKSL